MSTSSTIAQGLQTEIKARLAPPVASSSPTVEPFAMPPLAELYRAIMQARMAVNAGAAPLTLTRVPAPLRPFARLFYRGMRLALLPYFSRQNDFNHHVLDALDIMTREVERAGRR